MRVPYEACPLCNGTKVEHLGTWICKQHAMWQAPLPETMTWLRCLSCQHQFTDGYWTPEALDILFSKTQEVQKPGHNFELWRLLSSHTIDKILPWVNSGTWLDVGFGNGALLLTAREYGFQTLGIEARAATVGAMKDTDIDCRIANLADLEDKYQVISMMDVLEHMPFPKFALRQANRLISRHGVLLLSMPNIECDLWRQWGLQANPFWIELEHYHNFSFSRLADLLTKTGFSVTRYGISERYKACMEIIAHKEKDT